MRFEHDETYDPEPGGLWQDYLLWTYKDRRWVAKHLLYIHVCKYASVEVIRGKMKQGLTDKTIHDHDTSTCCPIQNTSL
jgi:hypothetical protein